MPIRKKLDDAAGKVCEAILPIKHDYYLGKGSELAICTLSSLDMLEEISKSDVMNKVVIAGRLLSENRGIDVMIRFTLEHPDLKRIIICGREVKGHWAGQALLALARNGIDSGGKIIGAFGPYPILKSQAKEVDDFRRQVAISDMIGTVNTEKLVP